MSLTLVLFAIVAAATAVAALGVVLTRSIVRSAVWLLFALIGVLQGSGATRTSLRINVWATLAIQVPVALLLGFGLGLDEVGVWWSFPIAFVAKAGMNYIELRRERWAVTGVRMTHHM